MNSYLETKDKKYYENNNLNYGKTKEETKDFKLFYNCNNKHNTLTLDNNTIKKYIPRRVLNIISKEYDFIDINQKIVTLRHKKCNFEFEVAYSDIINNHKVECLICSKKETKEKIKLELDVIYNNEYELVDIKNNNSYNKILVVKHKKCDKEISINYPEMLQLKLYCTNCNNKILEEDKYKYNIKDTEKNRKIKKDIEKKLNNEFEITGIFTGNKKHFVEMKHICGYEALMSPYNLIRKGNQNKCPECDRKRREENFLDKVNNKFEILSPYNGFESMIKVKKISCGHIYRTKAVYLLSDRYSCPICKDEQNLQKVGEKLKRLSNGKFSLTTKFYPKKDRIIEAICNDCGNTKKIKLDDIANSRISLCRYCVEIDRHNKFVEKIYNKFGEDFTVIGKYKNEKTPIKIKHNECGHIMENKPRNFLNIKTKCTLCEGLIKRDTKIVKNEISKLTNGEFSLRSEYKNNYTKILIKHNKCNRVFNAKARNFLKKPKCPYCDGVGSFLTQKEFTSRINNKYKGEYKVIGRYTSRRGTVEMLHTKCNELFLIEARKPLTWSVNTTLCPVCSEKNSTFLEFNKQQFLHKFNEKLGKEYSIISDTNNDMSLLKIKHLECGHEFEYKLNKIFNKTVLCPKCKRDNEKYLEIINKKIAEATQGEIELVGEYKGMNVYNTFIHKKCQTVFEKRLNSVLKYKMEHCPKCNKK